MLQSAIQSELKKTSALTTHITTHTHTFSHIYKYLNPSSHRQEYLFLAACHTVSEFSVSFTFLNLSTIHKFFLVTLQVFHYLLRVMWVAWNESSKLTYLPRSSRLSSMLVAPRFSLPSPNASLRPGWPGWMMVTSVTPRIAFATDVQRK